MSGLPFGSTEIWLSHAFFLTALGWRRPPFRPGIFSTMDNMTLEAAAWPSSLRKSETQSFQLSGFLWILIMRWQKIVFCRSDRLHFSEAAIWKGAAMNTSADIGSPQIGWNSSIFMISYTIFPWFLTRTCRNSLRHSHSGEPRLHLSALARLALRETLRSGSSKLPKATRGGHWSLFWDLRPNPVVLKIVFPIKIAKMGYPPFEIF